MALAVFSKKEKNTQRSPSDAIRLAAVMLSSKYRGSVAGLLVRCDRFKMDQPVNPTNTLFEGIVDTFNNIDFKVELPPEINGIPGINTIDVNDVDRIDSIKRDCDMFPELLHLVYVGRML